MGTAWRQGGGDTSLVTLETCKFIVTLYLEHFLQRPHGKLESLSGMHSHNGSFQGTLDNPSAFLSLVPGLLSTVN